jgi:hypothetical protein
MKGTITNNDFEYKGVCMSTAIPITYLCNSKCSIVMIGKPELDKCLWAENGHLYFQLQVIGY